MDNSSPRIKPTNPDMTSIIQLYAQSFVNGVLPPAHIADIIAKLESTTLEENTDEYDSFHDDAKRAIHELLQSNPKTIDHILADHDTWVAVNSACITSYVKDVETLLIDTQNPDYTYKELVLYSKLCKSAPQILLAYANNIAQPTPQTTSLGPVHSWINKTNKTGLQHAIDHRVLVVLFNRTIVQSKRNRHDLTHLLQIVDRHENSAIVDARLTQQQQDHSYHQILSTIADLQYLQDTAVFKAYILCCGQRVYRLTSTTKTQSHRNTPCITYQDLVNAIQSVSTETGPEPADLDKTPRKSQKPQPTQPVSSISTSSSQPTLIHPNLLPSTPIINATRTHTQRPTTYSPKIQLLPRRPKSPQTPEHPKHSTKLQPDISHEQTNHLPEDFCLNQPQQPLPIKHQQIQLYSTDMTEQQWITSIVDLLKHTLTIHPNPKHSKQLHTAIAIATKHLTSHQRRCPTVPSFDNVLQELNDIDAVKIIPTRSPHSKQTIADILDKWRLIQSRRFVPEKVYIHNITQQSKNSKTSNDVLALWDSRKTNSVNFSSPPLSIAIHTCKPAKPRKLSIVNLFQQAQSYLTDSGTAAAELQYPSTHIRTAGFLSPWQRQPFGTWSHIRIDDASIESKTCCLVVYTENIPDAVPSRSSSSPSKSNPSQLTKPLPSATKIAALKPGESIIIPPGYFHSELVIFDTMITYERCWFADRIETSFEIWHHQTLQQNESTHQPTLDRIILEHLISHKAYDWDTSTLTLLNTIHKATNAYNYNTRTCVCLIRGHTNCILLCNTQKRKFAPTHNQELHDLPAAPLQFKNQPQTPKRRFPTSHPGTV